MSFRTIALALVCTLLSEGCLPRSVQEHPRSQVHLHSRSLKREQRGLDLDIKQGSAKNDPKVAGHRKFWLNFSDSALHQLIRKALEENFQLRLMLARIEQAKAVRTQITAARYPTLSAAGNASFARTLNPVIGSTDVYNLNGSLPIRYEADLFARYRAASNAADFETQATRMDWLSARIVLAADVCEAWYDYVLAKNSVELVEEQIAANESYLQLLKERLSNGLAPEVDVSQQQQLLWASKKSLESVKLERDLAVQQLQLLVVSFPGKEPDQFLEQAKSEMPAPKAVEQLAVSGAIVSNRPDIQALRLRVTAADYRVGSAVAEYFPSLTFTVAPGYSWLRVESSAGNREIQGFTVSAGADLNVPIFDGFLRQGQVSESKSVLSQAIDELNQRTLSALVEIKNALVQQHAYARIYHAADQEFAATSAVLRDAKQRYQLGVTDFVPVLLASQNEQSKALEVLRAQRQSISARIALHRALSGDVSMNSAAINKF